MLIRSSQLTLERRRVPLGDLRVSEFAHSLNVRGLWIFSPRYLTVDLTGNSPPLTWQGSAAINGGIEGPGIDCSPSTTSGARLTFGSSSPLNITTGPGLSTFVRVARTANAQGSNAPYFGIGFQGATNPFVVSLIGTTGTTIGAPSWNWNTAGTLRQFQVFSNIWPAHTPTSFVLSHAFGSRVDAYYAGRLHNSDTTNTAAPSFGGSSDILCFGYDGVNARNSQASMFTGAVFAHPLSGSEAAALEAEPYALVEQRPLFLSMLSAGGANVQAGSPTAAAGTATVSATAASRVAAAATAAAGSATVSAVGATAPAAGTANAVPAAGTATVFAAGAARFASTAALISGASTVSAAGAARFASSASVIAGTCTVGAAGSSVANVGAASAVPAAGVATVAAIGGAVGTIASNAIPAAGVATVAAGAGSTAITVGTPKSELKPLFADRVRPRPQDFAAVIDSYADFSPVLRSWSASVTGASGVLRVRSPSSAEFMPFGAVAEQLAGANTTAEAIGILGASPIGDIVFRATSTAQAQSALGAGTVGSQVFGMTTTAQFASVAVQALSAATVAEVSAATATTVYVSPGTLVSHPGFAKAWCWFSVTAGVATLRSNYNITEVSAVSTGRFRFFMGAPMSLTAYAVIGTHSGEYSEDSTNIGFGYAANIRLKKLDRFDVFFGRPLGGANTNPAGMNDGEFYVAAYGWR